MSPDNSRAWAVPVRTVHRETHEPNALNSAVARLAAGGDTRTTVLGAFLVAALSGGRARRALRACVQGHLDFPARVGRRGRPRAHEQVR